MYGNIGILDDTQTLCSLNIHSLKNFPLCPLCVVEDTAAAARRGATAASAIDEAASAAAASEVTVARRLDVVNISKVAQNNNQVFDVAYYQNPETKVVIEAKVLNKMTSDPDEDDEEVSHDNTFKIYRSHLNPFLHF